MASESFTGPDITESFPDLVHINEKACLEGRVSNNCQLVAEAVDRALRFGLLACAFQDEGYFNDYPGGGYAQYAREYASEARRSRPECIVIEDTSIEFISALIDGDLNFPGAVEFLQKFNGYTGLIRYRRVTFQGDLHPHVANFVIRDGRLIIINAQEKDSRVYAISKAFLSDIGINSFDLYVTGPIGENPPILLKPQLHGCPGNKI